MHSCGCRNQAPAEGLETTETHSPSPAVGRARAPEGSGGGSFLTLQLLVAPGVPVLWLHPFSLCLRLHVAFSWVSFLRTQFNLLKHRARKKSERVMMCREGRRRCRSPPPPAARTAELSGTYMCQTWSLGLPTGALSESSLHTVSESCRMPIGQMSGWRLGEVASTCSSR